MPEPTELFRDAELAAIEMRTQDIGHQLFGRLEERRPNVFQRGWWDDRLMNWSMQNDRLKVALFRFVDVLPTLRDSDSVVRHLHEYLQSVWDEVPKKARTMLRLAETTALTRAVIARAARLSAMDFARRFIAGANLEEVLHAAERERRRHRAFTLDILGEAVISEREAEAFLAAYCDLIEEASPVVDAWESVAQIDHSSDGPLPRVNLSIKLSALDSQFDALDFAGTLHRAGGRLRELLRVARQHKAFVNVDMESYDKKDMTLAIFRHVLSEPEFRDLEQVGLVIQCYLLDSERDLAALADWVRERGTPIWMRLVKGAYWDYESTHAKAAGWPLPVFQEKWQSDANFERLTQFVLRHRRQLRPALASHNLRSLAHGIAVAEHLGLPPNAYELQMLYGMADAEKQALVDRGQRLRIYMPYGELIPGMAYLVRRLLENTANESFLRAGFVEHLSPDILLKPPSPAVPTVAFVPPVPSSNEEPPMPTFRATFRNEPPVDFAREENRQQMQAALDSVRGQFGQTYPLVINGEDLETDDRIDSLDPSSIDRIVGEVCQADRTHVDAAIAAAKSALPAWWEIGAGRRAEFLRRAAAAMRQRFFELAAWIVYECGKPWREATNDVCEAIDFCEYYAAGAEALQGPRGADVPGEENRFEYLPRGVAAVIAPWNFPLAILTGMTTAALVTGNTVVMKPAGQSPVIGAMLYDIFREVELPPGVLHYLPGRGETSGSALVEHPDVALIAFTGSRAVGLSINARAAEVSKSCHQVKRVIAEMGGKNAILIDTDADLDEAVAGVVKSAFGYQGQKCSACSRVIVLNEIHDAFVARLVEATRSLKVGPADDPGTAVGPVIDAAARDRIQRYIDIGREEGRLALAVDVGNLAKRGFYIGPHIFTDISPESRLAQEEIFGPVLAVLRATDFDDAIRIANSTDYALTGGVFSRSPAHLDQARRELQVGNLYLNRGITGALVGRQPFGGFRLSGIGSQAGGPDYLLQFVLPRTITENTMRRGFAPSE